MAITNIDSYSRIIAQTRQAAGENKADEKVQSPQTLEDFKKEIYGIINKMPVHPSQSQTQITVNISDKAFKKMMDDSEYKDKMLSTIQRDFGGSYPAVAAPSYMVIRIGDDCEYYADSMGAAYGDYFSGFQTNSFLQKNTKKSSTDYDNFNKRHMHQMVERRLQEQRILDIKNEEKAQAKKLEQSIQQKMAIAEYENNTIFEKE